MWMNPEDAALRDLSQTPKDEQRPRWPDGADPPPPERAAPPAAESRVPIRTPPPRSPCAVYAVRGRLARGSGASRGTPSPGAAGGRGRGAPGGRAGGRPHLPALAPRPSAQPERDIRYIVGIPGASRDRRVSAAPARARRPPRGRGARRSSVRPSVRGPRPQLPSPTPAALPSRVLPRGRAPDCLPGDSPGSPRADGPATAERRDPAHLRPAPREAHLDARPGAAPPPPSPAPRALAPGQASLPPAPTPTPGLAPSSLCMQVKVLPLLCLQRQKHS
ncbi:basic proline-rich protein-like [Globicephala melas]|uniref:basic proline-rich protein-like n=1 Tax=Globicephala melas TaxID=9731 RepID=UPI00387381E4